ncbi:MAG: CsgG/HfaB family protein [Treponema sp.]|nr:CsgG/HfaB family protein [Treponema sp.]
MKNVVKLFGAQGKSLCAATLALLVSFSLAFTACASDPAPVPVPVRVQVPAPAPSVSVLDELSMSIRHVSNYLNDTLPEGSMVVFMNVQSDSEQLSDFIIDELLANAVNDRVFTVVDRQQLDVIRTEQNLQLSGDVDDETALSVGRFLGAQTIVSGRISSLGGHYRLTIRALEVETARLQGQYNQNIGTVATINALMGGGAQAAQAPAQRAAQAPEQQAVQVPAQQAPPPPPPIVGTIVPGDSLSEKLVWLQRSANSHGTYILEVRNDETIAPHTFEFRGAINITIVLRGIDENRTIRLGSNGTMFTVRRDITLILDNNITLQGHGQNNGRLVAVAGGIFRMNTGSSIVGNTGGGVELRSGTFEMNGGTISGNTANRGGGGVSISGGTFTMINGTISGNTANRGGGGVSTGTIGGAGTFTMRGGIITGNTAHEDGGGVHVQWGNFTMHGGTISGNIAATAGGGVRVGGNAGRGIFEKRGGTITGFINDPSNGNVVRDGNGVLARMGHAVFVNTNRRRETTAGPSIQMNSGRAGGWES